MYVLINEYYRGLVCPFGREFILFVEEKLTVTVEFRREKKSPRSHACEKISCVDPHFSFVKVVDKRFDLCKLQSFVRVKFEIKTL